jgi:hypothetical protein
MKGLLAFRLLLLTLPVSLLTGCVTGALWEDGAFARYHQPASPPKVQLLDCRAKQDVLVLFDEVRDTDGRLRRRAYWARENASRIGVWRAPRYFPGPVDPDWPSVPVFLSGNASGAANTSGMHAVLAADGRAFTLFSPGVNPMVFDLPVYRDASGRAKQVLLTPLAVIADVTVVGAVVAFVTMPCWWESLNHLAE